ncbi:hypothetical protein TNCV_4074561 [Trichonephila clavipes]|uniref:Uncharacterized protein n=1 Tax=Trichonephila clavipes TaxID=2585209 RepID=A0A8X6W871_TRICX|nr:hypothetical protein TNCV_4074561 [Trichonephila clavipes]
MLLSKIAVDQYTWTNILPRFKNSQRSAVRYLSPSWPRTKSSENDAHWDTALADASNTASTTANTHAICHNINNQASHLIQKDLWEKYKDYMSEDILHRLCAANQNPTFNSHQTCIKKH